MSGRRTIPVLLFVLVGVVASGGGSFLHAQDRGICVSANVPEPFTLPDGIQYAAGRLTLCTVQALNPVVGLHRLSPDGNGAKFAMSKRAVAEAKPEGDPQLLFRCAPGELLDLVGYVVPVGRFSWSYSLKHSQAPSPSPVEAAPLREDPRSTPQGHGTSGIRSIPAELNP